MANEIVVKVGKSSNIKINGRNITRAITMDDVRDYLNTDTDAKIIIIESISNKEYDTAREVIESALNESKHKVYFYTSIEDETTCGLADEFACEIYLDVNRLYEAIEGETKVNIRTGIGKMSRSQQIGEEELSVGTLSFDFPESSEDEYGQNQSDNQKNEDNTNSISNIGNLADLYQSMSEVDEIELPAISSKNDLDELYTSGDELNVSSEIADKQREVAEGIKEAEDNLRSALYKATSENTSLKQQITKERSDREQFERQLELHKDVKDSTLYKELEAKYEELRDRIENDEYSLEDIDITDSDEYKALEAIVIALEADKKELMGQKSELGIIVSSLKKEVEDITIKTDSDEFARGTKAFKDLMSEFEAEKLLNGQLNEELELASKSSDEKVVIIDSQLKAIQEDYAALKEKSEKQRIDSEDLRARIHRQYFELVERTIIGFEQYSKVKKALEETSLQLDETKDLLEKTAKLKMTAETQLNEERTKNQQLENELTEAKRQVVTAQADIKAELEKVTAKLSKEQADGAIKQSNYSELKTRYDSLIMRLGTDENGAEKLIASMEEKDKLNNELTTKVAELQTSMVRMNNTSRNALERSKEAEEEAVNLREQIRALSDIGDSAGKQIRIQKINYDGAARIIPIIGANSSGITTTAISMAEKLAIKNKVLVIDWDLTSPTIDAWFQKSPYLKGIKSIETNVKATATGILLEHGVGTIGTYFQQIVISISKTRSGQLDYFAGVHYKFNQLRLMITDFQSLFAILGARYDYIIIDFGRIGDCGGTDELARAVCQIAYNIVVIASADKFVMRNTKTKLREIGVDINKTVWNINRCTTTKPDEVKRLMEDKKEYVLLPFDNTIFEQRASFSKSVIIRDRFEGLINMTLAEIR